MQNEFPFFVFPFSFSPTPLTYSFGAVYGREDGGLCQVSICRQPCRISMIPVHAYRGLGKWRRGGCADGATVP